LEWVEDEVRRNEPEAASTGSRKRSNRRAGRPVTAFEALRSAARRAIPRQVALDALVAIACHQRRAENRSPGRDDHF
jgi:hypothetical protein